ncbi:circadian clock-controlled protein daywake-like [Schistocerca serialis cubense]|uniref:circadian clock-controlled protein daywake-like n=1 Tax=Schistocerca serialis cubense TaxID=2023355 RepID=UPI00214E5A4D|nr:circadian clock-controlled protein daywake-like [Schistocerca serialis cubense]
MPARGAALLLLSAALVAVRAAYLKEKPAFLTTCYLKDPQFEDCFVKQLQSIFARLVDGFPEIGALPLDPLEVTQVAVLADGEGPVAVNSTLTGMKIRGLSQAKAVQHRFNPKTLSLDSRLQIPRLSIDSKYKLSGRLLVLPINGNGDVHIEPENMDVRVHQKMSLVEREGRRFFHVDSSKVNFTVGGLKMEFTNLYNGQKALEESTNKYLNDNWEVAFDSLKPVLTETIEDLLTSILGRLLDKVPVEYFVGDISSVSS